MKRLKNKFLISLLTVSGMGVFPSCQMLQTKFPSKRYLKTVGERDSLQRLSEELMNDTTSMGLKIRKLSSEFSILKEDYMELNDNFDELTYKYKELTNTSLSQKEQLNLALKQKSSELQEKERLLKEREQRLGELQAIINKQDSLTNALNDIVRKALLGFQADELSVEMKNGKVYVSLSDKLLFKSGSAAVEEKGRDAIKKLAEVLNKNTEIDILIEGHTDNIPIKTALYKDNWDLSVARATSIVRMLNEDFRVSAPRLTAAGKGEFVPKAPNDTPDGRAKNRRTEIILSPKLDQLFKLIQAK